MRVTNYWKLIKDTHSGKDFIQLYFCMWCCGDVSGDGPLSSHATDFFNCLIWRATWWASGQQLVGNLVGNIIGQLGGQQLVGNLVGNNWWSTQNHLGKFLGGRHTTFLVFVFVFVASLCGNIASLAGNNSGGIASRNSRPEAASEELRPAAD